MCLTRRERYRLITGHELPMPGTQTITYEKTGPGEFDALRSLDEKTDNWQTIQTSYRHIEKPKIIFCYPALSKSVLTQTEDSLLDGLCEDFDVYLWQGPRPFSEMRPIANDKLFREKMGFAVANLKEDVLHVFEQQRLSTSNIYVWDLNGYRNMISKAQDWVNTTASDIFYLSEVDSKPNYVNTKQFDLLDESFTKNFNKELRSLYLFAPSIEEVIKVRQIFPNLERIKISNISIQWLNDLLKLCHQLHVTLEGNDYVYLPHLVLNQEIQLRGLTITKFSSLESIELKGAQIGYLRINACGLFKNLICDSLNRDLINLHISYSKKLVKLNLIPFNKLSFLSIMFCPSFNPEQLILPKNPMLEVIRLNEWFPSQALFDFSNCAKLKRIDFLNRTVPKIQYKLPPHMTTLGENKEFIESKKIKTPNEIYAKTVTNYEEFQQLAVCPNCERVDLTPYRLRKKEMGDMISFDACPQIKSVTLQDVEKGGVFCDLTALKDLEEITLPSFNMVTMPVSKSLRRICLNSIAPAVSFISFLEYELLETLEVRGNGNQIILPNHSTRLRTLFLINVRLPENFNFDRYPNLDKLILYNCSGLEKTTLPAFLQCLIVKHSTLRELNYPKTLKIFTYWGSHEQSINFNLSDLTQLISAEINVSTSPGYSIAIMCHGCTQLQELSITARHNHIMLMLDNSKNIKYLNISILNGFKLITASGLENCHNLRSLNLTLGNLNDLIKLIPKDAFKHNVNLVTTSPEENKELIATEKERKLTLQNSRSPVTFFSSEYIDTIDAKTMVEEKYRADPNQYQFAGTIFSKSPKQSHLYRINPLNSIYWIGDTIDFYVSFNLRKINLTPEPLPSDISNLIKDIPENTLFTYMEGKAKRNHPVPILGVQAIEKPEDVLKIFVEPVGSADIVWNMDTQQCYAVPKTTNKIRILLQVKENIAYEKEQINIAKLVTRSPEAIFAPPSKEAIQLLLNLHSHDEKLKKLFKNPPKSLLKPILQKLSQVDKKQNPEFAKLHQQLFESSLNSEQKFQAIIDYCKNQFTEGKLDAKEDQPLDVLVESIVKRKGACRHASRAFWALAGLIGVPVLMSRNEQHQFVDFPYRGNTGTHFQRLDLGGLHRPDVTPARVREDFLTKLVSAQITSDIKEMIPPQILLEEAKEKLYYHSLKKLITPRYFKDWNELFNSKDTLPPLIELATNQDALQYCEQLFHTFQENKFDMDHFHTIHSVEEFKKFFEPLALVDGQWQRLPNGPLKETMKLGGVLVIDWSSFSDAEVASYKSILDKPPMLFEYPFPLRVINLAKENSASCIAFKSRTQPCLINQKLLIKPNEKKKEEPLTTLTIDLFGNLSWRKYVYGKLKFQGKTKTLTESPFIQAIKDKKPLKIIFNQPPQDRDFAIFKYRLEVEKRVFFNGKFIKVGSDIKIEIQNKAYDDKPPANLVLNIEEKKPHNPIYISANDIHELKEQLVVDEKQEGYTLPGLIETAREDDVFYSTEPIPKEEQIPLYQFIAQLNKTVKLIIADEMKIKITDRLFVSNDPDYLTEQLAIKHDALIIDVTPNTTFKSLIAEIEDSLEGFKYHERDMLKLLATKNIILNGAISSTLYHQLLPLFIEPSQIRTNGQNHNVAGKLILVQPKDAYFIPKQSQFQEYHFSDYRKRLVNDIKDNEIFSKIEKFYEIISQINDHGPGIPKKPTPSYHLLKKMVQELKKEKPLHKRNPIKAIFSYDYPKESEEYAFVNVMAKRLFTANDTTEKRHYKLHKIMQQFNIKSPEEIKTCLWRILNCFNGAELCKLFQDSDLIQNGDIPKLPDSFMTEIFKRLPQQSPPMEKKADRSRKQMAEFKSLLAEEDADFVMLKGGTGVGKTEAVRRVLPGEYSELHNIHEWLSGDKKYLLLDEANIQKPGMFDFLKGLTRKNRLVYYPPTGKFYEIPPGKKVIMTANPENFPGRHWHDFFQKYVTTCYFKKPSDAELKSTTLALLSDNLKDHLLFAYHLFEKYNPFLTSSYRDIENLRDRFLCLEKSGDSQALFNACIGQYAGAIQNLDTRKSFIDELKSHFGIVKIKQNHEVRKIGKIYITPQKDYLIDAITQDLLMRDAFVQKSLEAKEAMSPSYKPAVVIEGEPGTGKSSLFRALAVKYDPITISGGSSNVDKILVEAFHAGRIVILDEFNLDPHLEILKNELMSGRYQGQLANKPGFMILASQNTSGLAGRKSQSPAEINRTHFLYMDPFTHRERIMIAEAAGIHSPKAFANAYKRICSESTAVTMRTFFIALEDEMLKQAALKKASIKPLSANTEFAKDEKDPVKIWMHFMTNRLGFLQQNDPKSSERVQIALDLKALEAYQAGKDITDLPKSEALQSFLKRLI